MKFFGSSISYNGEELYIHVGGKTRNVHIVVKPFASFVFL
jgi:hypothetical protein